MADETAAIVVAAQYLPAEAPDGFVGGDARQFLGGAVPRDYGQVGFEGEERIARSKLRCR
jgi:hypothetical protein